jgi:protein-disulfide isomerase
MSLKPPVSMRDHAEGPDDAVVTLVEFGDYQCPYCVRAHPIVKKLQRHFGESLRFVFRNFPLSQLHPMAQAAAEAAEFAAVHGKFWEMHDALYESQSLLSPDLLSRFANAYGLDVPALSVALREGTFRGRVQSDFNSGITSGVNGTPTFFINGHRHDDSFEYQVLLAALEAAR